MANVLDTFLISMKFDSTATKQSASQIQNTVDDLVKKITASLTAIASVDFLKDVVDKFAKLSTQLDNLSWQTGNSVNQLQAWGQAVARVGGTAEGFYQSVTNLSNKLYEMQTSFGSGGQLVFARLGISIKDSNGHIKNSIQILTELSTKFKNMPRAWQLNLGRQLGLDEGTIRLLAQGNVQVTSLVAKMQKLSEMNNINSKEGIKYRNALLDLQLAWQGLSVKIALVIIPPVVKFMNIINQGITYIKQNKDSMTTAFVAIASVISATLIPVALRLALAFAPFIAMFLVIQDFIVWLHGGKSALGSFYQYLFKTRDGAMQFIDKVKEFAPTLLKITAGIIAVVTAFKVLNALLLVGGLVSGLSPLLLALTGIATAVGLIATNWDKVKDGIKNSGIKEGKGFWQGTVDTLSQAKNGVFSFIGDIAKKMGFDSTQASTIANIESGGNANAQNSSSSAGGLFQFTNSTWKQYATKLGLGADKFNAKDNAIAGVQFLKDTSDQMSKFLGRKPTGGELHIGMYGMGNARAILGANQNTMLSSILDAKTVNANHWAGMTAGQLRAREEATYNSKQVNMTVGDIHVVSNSHDPVAVANQVTDQLNKKIQQVARVNQTGRIV